MNTLCDVLNCCSALWHMAVYMIITRTRLSWPGPDLWPDLDTSLVTCNRLHILTSVACLLLWHLPSTFIRVVIMYITVQLFILLFGFLYLQLFLLLFMHCLSARAVPFTHTLTMVAFWRPWICTSRYWTFVSVVQMFVALIYIARSLSLSFLDYRYSCSFIHVTSWFYPYCIQLFFFPSAIHLYHVSITVV